MKDYEMVMILDPGLDPTSFEEKTKILRDKLTKYEGVVQNVTSWGKRKLAYDIAKKDAGYYVVFNFQISSQGLLDFKENIRHDTEILRYLIVVNRQPLAQMTTTEEETAKEGRDEEEVQEIEAEEEIEHADEDDLDDHVNEEEK
jgi:small subunit ribosomal protein S6